MKRTKELTSTTLRWQFLDKHVNRIESFKDADFVLALENCKGLIESVAKEICRLKNVELDSDIKFGALIKKTCVSMGYDDKSFIYQVSGAMTNITNNIGKLRNDYGSVSHGRNSEDIKNLDNEVDEFTRYFLIDSTDSLVSLLIKCFDYKYVDKEGSENHEVVEIKEKINYNNKEFLEFNDFWDDSIGSDYQMTEDYSFANSEILHALDYDAYLQEYNTYKDNKGA